MKGEHRSKRARNVPQHNYVRKLHYLWKIGALPKDAGYHQVSVAHDDGCGPFEGQRCNCNPDVTLPFSLAGAARH
jgi:hypothetical protein